jgi:hypothetical protein
MIFEKTWCLSPYESNWSLLTNLLATGTLPRDSLCGRQLDLAPAGMITSFVANNIQFSLPCLSMVSFIWMLFHDPTPLSSSTGSSRGF